MTNSIALATTYGRMIYALSKGHSGLTPFSFSAKLPSKRWRDLILRVWHVDPLRRPACQNPMRVIAVMDGPQVVEKILRHLGAWHDPPPRPPPKGVPGPYTYKPCDDADPMPDYENVLTD